MMRRQKAGFEGLSATQSVLTGIARPYAAALFELASDAKAVEATEKSLDVISGLIASSDDFSRFLKSPAISTEDKRDALEAILQKAGIAELVANTLRLVARNGRLAARDHFRFQGTGAAARNEIAADVVSATKLTTAQEKELAKSSRQSPART